MYLIHVLQMNSIGIAFLRSFANLPKSRTSDFTASCLPYILQWMNLNVLPRKFHAEAAPYIPAVQHLSLRHLPPSSTKVSLKLLRLTADFTELKHTSFTWFHSPACGESCSTDNIKIHITVTSVSSCRTLVTHVRRRSMLLVLDTTPTLGSLSMRSRRKLLVRPADRAAYACA